MTESYDHDSLGGLAARGTAALQIWCLAPRCRHRSHVAIDALIARLGPHIGLLQLARRLRCTACGRSGCYPEPARPPAPGTPDRPAWAEGEMARLREQLAALEGEASRWRSSAAASGASNPRMRAR